MEYSGSMVTPNLFDIRFSHVVLPIDINQYLNFLPIGELRYHRILLKSLPNLPRLNIGNPVSLIFNLKFLSTTSSSSINCFLGMPYLPKNSFTYLPSVIL